jgi:histidinol-phosphate/aromatic aminotransferase/cobyric acid decarboxylase-like protein
MRKSSVLDALFPAIRQQILAATLLEPEKWWYLTELASHLGTSPSSMLKRLEQSFQREINVTRYSEKEFKQKIQNKDHFLLSVLNEKVVMIKGAQDELEAAARAT